MEVRYQFGYPMNKRAMVIADALNSPHALETQHEEYRGKYRPLKIIEVPIELLVYRIENIRTKSLQKQWLVTHPDCQKNFFTADPGAIEVQEAQHQILQSLADKEGLLDAFKKGKLQQKEALIATDDGVVVNGNRRLCAWRTLYYSDRIKYAHFQTVRVAVLPDHDPQGIYDLEVALQIHSDMKAEYTWHSIAADYKEKVEQGVDLPKFAQKQGESAEEINRLIECYEYAEQYLESINHTDEWSLVDKQEFAFRQIVSSRKGLTNPGDKELFQEIAKAMLQTPASGDRLYKQIPKVVKNLASIAPKLSEVFGITISDSVDDDLSLLLDGDNTETGNTNSQIASGIRTADAPELVVRTVKAVLETSDEIEKEKKKKTFVYDQVKKAADILTNTISNMDPSMSKDGVEKQLDNIDIAVGILNDWIRK